jgi:hypothetical protein
MDGVGIDDGAAVDRTDDSSNADRSIVRDFDFGDLRQIAGERSSSLRCSLRRTRTGRFLFPLFAWFWASALPKGTGEPAEQVTTRAEPSVFSVAACDGAL